MSKIKEDAEFFRLSLEAGLCPVEEAVAWCDAIIMEEAQPDVAIIDASLEGKQGCSAVAEVLRNVDGDCNYNQVAHHIFAIMLTKLRQDHSQGMSILKAICLVFKDGSCPISLATDAEPFFEELYWRSRGAYGGAAPIIDQVIEFLEDQT